MYIPEKSRLLYLYRIAKTYIEIFIEHNMGMRARREFRRLKPQFADSRRENLEEASTDTIPERVNFSLLWRYYIKRQKTYSSLIR